ncbi:ABC transporter ATP-binding protein [Paenibacillus yanchengensis]|uniref:ABC transporter ATP-binding protein n=1 Tax=Paenibacillus yanchengensis TaxID=2035833 RepID=A0ABW4YGZ7_9BACL
MSTNQKSILLDVAQLQKKFPVYGSFGKIAGAKQYVHAINNVSFQLYEGEVYGLVGESGSGKSTTARTLLGLIKANAGSVSYQGQEVTSLTAKALRRLRKEIQMVFQDPYSSLNPRKTIGQILEEPLKIHGIGSREERQATALQLLQTVGLQAEHYFHYPHKLSGGQRQRIGLARALILQPKLLICDEPVSALDVSIQSQILNMLRLLQQDMNLTMLFITHDISVVRYISDRIGVMYLGKLVEEATTEQLFDQPLHPYTKALFSSVPNQQDKQRERITLQGEIPSPIAPPTGCMFHTRCPYAVQKCRVDEPVLQQVADHHRVACHLIGEGV